MDLSEFPSSEAEFRARFADNDRCREYLARLKWPEGFRCVHCSGDRAYFLPSKRVVYECVGCGQQVSLIAGTIFEQSKKSLVLWFRAVFEVTASKQGIAAAQILKKANLKYKVVQVVSPTVPKGVVISQKPAANTKVPAGSTVELTLSKGPT